MTRNERGLVGLILLIAVVGLFLLFFWPGWAVSRTTTIAPPPASAQSTQQSTTGTGTQPVQPQAVQPAPVTGITQQGSFQLGCNGKDVGAVQALIGLSVVCNGTEYDAYTWRSVPIVVDANLPQGWIGTLHLADDRIVVTQTPGKYQIKAATFRRISGYPASDAVYNPCSLLVKEQAFGASQTPSFPVEPLGFSCPIGQPATTGQQPVVTQQQPAAIAPAPVAPAPAAQAPQAGNACLSPDQATSSIGGSGWTYLPGSNNEGLKYGPGASPATLKAPVQGRIDYSGGSLRNGQSAGGISEATYWCNG